MMAYWEEKKQQNLINALQTIYRTKVVEKANINY